MIDSLHSVRLREDASADDRFTGALQAGQLLLNQPEGYGLGVPQDLIAKDGSFSLNDNGFANGFLALGLLPGLLYFCSLALLLAKSFRNFRHKPPEARVIAVAAIAIAAQLPLDTAYLGPTGVLLWMFSSLASRAGNLYSLLRIWPAQIIHRCRQGRRGSPEFWDPEKKPSEHSLGSNGDAFAGGRNCRPRPTLGWLSM